MTQLNPSLEDYKKYLVGLLETKSPDIIFNGKVEYAAVLMSSLFESSNKEILMYSTGLKPNLTEKDDYLISFKKYIEKDGKLKLLVQTTEYAEKSKAFSFLLDRQKKGNRNIEIKIIDPDYKKEMLKELNSDDCNFSVFDDKMLRFEYVPDEYKAFASFNDPVMAKRLSEVFYKAFDKNASPYPSAL